MPQTLHTQHGDITFVTLWKDQYGRSIGELPNGGWCREDSNPIQDASEFEILRNQPAVYDRALAWWEGKDQEPDAPEVRALLFAGDRLLYADTLEEVETHADILAAFPDPGPFQRAALEWWAQKHWLQQQQAAGARGYDQRTGVVSAPESPPPDDGDGVTGMMEATTEVYVPDPPKRSHHKKP